MLYACNASQVFGDGTFSYCSKLFTQLSQLYTIYICQNYFNVPVVFNFLEEKHASTINIHSYMWETLQNICTHILERQLIIKKFLVDFEKSAHNSILKFQTSFHCVKLYAANRI